MNFWFRFFCASHRIASPRQEQREPIAKDKSITRWFSQPVERENKKIENKIWRNWQRLTWLDWRSLERTGSQLVKTIFQFDVSHSAKRQLPSSWRTTTTIRTTIAVWTVVAAATVMTPTCTITTKLHPVSSETPQDLSLFLLPVRNIVS